LKEIKKCSIISSGSLKTEKEVRKIGVLRVLVWRKVSEKAEKKNLVKKKKN